MKEVVIVGVLWIFIGCFQGMLVCYFVVELGSMVVKVLIECIGVDVNVIDEVIFGQVLMVGVGQNLVCQLVIKGGLLIIVFVIIINDVCGFGLKVLYLVMQVIQCGEVDIVIVGGQENMSCVLYVFNDSCIGVLFDVDNLVDSLVYDGLWDVFNDYYIGVMVENLVWEYGISCELQDVYVFSLQ